MSTVECDTDGVGRTMLDVGLGVDPAMGELTTWLVDPSGDDPGSEWSLRCDHSVHDAVVHGLAQYVWGVRTSALGRQLGFNRVTEDFADSADESVDRPVATVNGEQGEGRYAAPINQPQFITRSTPAQRSMTTPGIVPTVQENVRFIEPGSGVMTNLVWTALYSFDQLLLTITCSSKLERSAMVKAIEDAFSPFVDSGGVKLRLGHYYGAVARYTLESQIRPDSAGDAVSDTWLATFRFRVECPTIRVHRTAYALPTAQATIA